jgi:hypothetical protein
VTDISGLRPGDDIFDSEGSRLGRIAALSGDRFLLSAEGARVWISYDWITRVHRRCAVVQVDRNQLADFRDALPSRWARLRAGARAW